jgi:hypothetical protein
MKNKDEIEILDSMLILAKLLSDNKYLVKKIKAMKEIRIVLEQQKKKVYVDKQ